MNGSKNGYPAIMRAVLVREVKRILRENGLFGDPLTESRRVGTFDEQAAFITLASQIPTRYRRQAPKLCKWLLRNGIRNSR